MSRIFRVIPPVLCLALLVAGGYLFCSQIIGKAETPETTQPVVTTAAAAEPVTEPAETTAATTEPTEPTKPTKPTEPTETQPEDPEEILRAVVENQRQLRLESGSVMYLCEYMAMHQGTKVSQWQFLDMNGDGEREIFAVTDSADVSYLVIHWDGADPRCFGFGFREVQELKEDGAMAGANSASGMVFYRVDFQGGQLVTTVLAEFDTEEERYAVGSKQVSRRDMEDFLKNWNRLPSVIGGGVNLPAEENYTCAYCGDSVESLMGELCGECFEFIDKCDLCGKWSEDIFEGVCSECEPHDGWGEEGDAGYCDRCGIYSEELLGQKCPTCFLLYKICDICGMWVEGVVDGACSNCRGNDSSGNCMLCGVWCEELLNDMCSDCFWYYDQCDICGNWVEYVDNGVCEDCQSNDDSHDGGGHCQVCGIWCEELEGKLCEECFWRYTQCRLCGKWSEDVFEGLCSECEPNGGMG